MQNNYSLQTNLILLSNTKQRLQIKSSNGWICRLTHQRRMGSLNNTHTKTICVGEYLCACTQYCWRGVSPTCVLSNVEDIGRVYIACTQYCWIHWVKVYRLLVYSVLYNTLGEGVSPTCVLSNVEYIGWVCIAYIHFKIICGYGITTSTTFCYLNWIYLLYSFDWLTALWHRSTEGYYY